TNIVVCDLERQPHAQTPSVTCGIRAPCHGTIEIQPWVRNDRQPKRPKRLTASEDIESSAASNPDAAPSQPNLPARSHHALIAPRNRRRREIRVGGNDDAIERS